MKVVLFGATGMIGQGVLRECLVADDVDAVVSVVRRPSGVTHEKLHEVVHEDFSDFSSIPELVGADACFYCLGISSVGMSEAEYTRVTYDYALAAARARPSLIVVLRRQDAVADAEPPRRGQIHEAARGFVGHDLLGS